jgi:hypothetical protein
MGGGAHCTDLVREAAGGRFAGIELNAQIRTVEVSDSVRRTAGTARDSDLSAEEALDSPLTLFGSHGAMADALRDGRELLLGLSYSMVFELQWTSFAG